MEKRIKGSRTLNGLLLGYLVRTAAACMAVGVLWFGVFLGLISGGFVLPAYSGSDATLRAMEQLTTMSAEHFDADALPDLCRWVLLDGSVAPGETADPDQVLNTNMTEHQLSLALALGSPPIYSQFYRDVPLIDGTLCRLQYDFATPYADPALRGRLPDFQICMTLVLVVLLVATVVVLTRRTARRLRDTTRQLSDACRVLASGDLARPMPAPTRVREFDQVLQTMDGLRGELAQSLKAQWQMEQQRTRRMAALTHDLKTPLTIVQGNAELLAEETLSPAQRPAVEAILRGTHRAEQYLAALRDACRAEQYSAAPEPWDAADFVETLAQTGRSLCALRDLTFTCENQLPAGTRLHLRRQDMTRAVENLLANAVRFAPPEQGHVDLCCRREGETLVLAVTDNGPGFPPEILQQGGGMFATGDSARSDGHQGLGLYFARTVAQAHGGGLELSNTDAGARAALRLPAGVILPPAAD